jgi:hypothetical protein
LRRPDLPSGAREPQARASGQRAFNLDWLAVPLALVLLAALAIPRLPPGICTGDSGDLQVSSATLGMAHPPGYGGFVSVGYVLTLIPGLDPAYAVTLGCLACALIALAFLAALQIRLGAQPMIAAAVTLALAASTRIWEALIVPEVYAPNLALHAAAVWFLLTYVQTGRLSRLGWAALLLGFAIANRPSALLTLPGFAVVLIVYWWQNKPAVRKSLIATAISLAGLLLPSVYTLGYDYVRDRAGLPFNIIENRRITHGDLPAANADLAGESQRLLWLVTARDFRGLLGGSRVQMTGRAQWLVERLGLSNDIAMILATCATVIGGAIAWRRSRHAAIVLIGAGLGAVAFFCAYEVYDTAADVLPIIFVGGIFIGLCVSAVLPAKRPRTARVLSVLVFIAAGVWVTYRISRTAANAGDLDATHSAPAAQLRNLPPGAAVFSDWIGAAPLRYAQCRVPRPDVLIVVKPPNPAELAARLCDAGHGRPVFSTARVVPRAGYEVVPCGALWHIRPISAAAADIDAGAAPERHDGVNEGRWKY